MAWLLGWAMAKSLGGLTGDTYGATNEIIETTMIIVATALASHEWLVPIRPFLGDHFVTNEICRPIQTVGWNRVGGSPSARSINTANARTARSC